MYFFLGKSYIDIVFYKISCYNGNSTNHKQDMEKLKTKKAKKVVKQKSIQKAFNMQVFRGKI